MIGEVGICGGAVMCLVFQARRATRFLIEYLQLRSPGDVFQIIEAYYPRRLIPPKTQFLIEEILPKPPDA